MSSLNINISPTKKQNLCWQKLRDKTTKFILFGGGGGGAKSWLGCEWLLTMCLAYPGLKGFIGRNELKRLMSSTFVTFLKVCDWHKIPREIWKLNEKYNYIQFFNGSRIDLLDVAYQPSDPLYERFGSIEYTCGWLEEVGEIPEKAFDVLKSRIGRHLNDELGVMSKMFLTCNPKKNWVYIDFYKPWVNGILPKDRCFIQALYRDNPFTAKEYEENLNQIKDPVLRQRLRDGIWEYEEGDNVLMKYDNIISIFSNQYTFSEDEQMYMTVDPARFGKDKATMFIWQGNYIKHIWWWDKSSISFLKEKIISKCRQHRIPFSNVAIDEAGIGCLVRGAEVFTPNGWKKAEELKISDKIYSKDEDDNVVIESIKDIHYTEPTKIIEDKNGYRFSYCHSSPSKVRKEYNFKVQYWEDTMNKSIAYLDNSFNWTGKAKRFIIPCTKYKMPYGGFKKINNKIDIDSHAIAKFLGWFLSEGCFDANAVTIIQSHKSIYNNDIVKCLNSLGINPSVTHRDESIRYRIHQKNLVEWLKKECYTENVHNALTKKIPSYIMNSDKDTIRTFLDEYNKGDGTIHHGSKEYFTSSNVMAEQIMELVYKSGKYGNIRIKHKKGSVGHIYGRKLTRTADMYVIYEYKNRNILFYPNIEREYYDNVYNVKITGNSKLFMVRFKNKRAFWTHNGGLVDDPELFGVKGFVDGSRPVEELYEDTQDTRKYNYKNLRAQCYFKLAELVNKGEVGCYPEITPEVKTWITEELEAVRRKDGNSETTLQIIPKDSQGGSKQQTMKDLLGRSPDFADAMKMKMLFNLGSNDFELGLVW